MPGIMSFLRWCSKRSNSLGGLCQRAGTASFWRVLDRAAGGGEKECLGHQRRICPDDGSIVSEPLDYRGGLG